MQFHTSGDPARADGPLRRTEGDQPDPAARIEDAIARLCDAARNRPVDDVAHDVADERLLAQARELGHTIRTLQAPDWPTFALLQVELETRGRLLPDAAEQLVLAARDAAGA